MGLGSMGASKRPTPRALITTPEDFIDAILQGRVAEVSPLLYGTITNPSFGTLSNPLKSKVWVSSSANLYQLLILNQRYKNKPARRGEQDLDGVISPKAMDGLARIVGIPQNNDFTTTNPLLILQDNTQGAILGKASIPGFKHFRDLINSYRPKGSQQIPTSIYTSLRSNYSQISPNSKGTPLKAFSALSGLSIARLRHLGGNTIKTPLTNPTRDITAPKIYAAYRQALEAISPNGTSNGMAADTENFFNNFATSLLQNKPKGWEKQLAIGTRGLLFLTYSASPLWSSFGIGYRNDANPLIGRPSSKLKGLQIYAGQEFQINNTTWRDNEDITVKLVGSGAEVGTPAGSYLKKGWFKLNPAIKLGAGIVDATTLPKSLKAYRWNGIITSTATILIFPKGSLSSNTVNASNIHHTTGNLSPNTFANHHNTKKLSERGGLVGELLPQSFALYIDTAGGADVVTGSRFNDVIIGSTARAPHGQFTASAGAGDDVIRPGRGGSLLQTGPGQDKVVIDNGDLFGETILMDFDTTQDQLIIRKNLSISGVGTGRLTLGDANDPFASKTLVLSGDSSTTWTSLAITRV